MVNCDEFVHRGSNRSAIWLHPLWGATPQGCLQDSPPRGGELPGAWHDGCTCGSQETERWGVHTYTHVHTRIIFTHLTIMHSIVTHSYTCIYNTLTYCTKTNSSCYEGNVFQHAFRWQVWAWNGRDDGGSLYATSYTWKGMQLLNSRQLVSHWTISKMSGMPMYMLYIYSNVGVSFSMT